MTNPNKGEFTLRPFPVAVIAADDKPCPKAQHEQTREKLFPFYRHAAQEMRNWRRSAHEASQQRQAARNPLAWLLAAGRQVEARIEGHLASRRHRVMAGQLDNEVVNNRLGWPSGTPAPSCPQAAQERPGVLRAAATFATIAALTITPLRPDLTPLTPTQRLDAALAFAAICGTGNGPKREMLCHAPKVSLRPRRNEAGGDNALA